MPGFCFSKTDWVSGIIWSVISGLDTTATVTVPDVPPFPAVLAVLLLLEHAAIAASMATQPAVASVRGRNRAELMHEPPRYGQCCRAHLSELLLKCSTLLHTLTLPLGKVKRRCNYEI